MTTQPTTAELPPSYDALLDQLAADLYWAQEHGKSAQQIRRAITDFMKAHPLPAPSAPKLDTETLAAVERLESQLSLDGFPPDWVLVSSADLARVLKAVKLQPPPSQ